MKWGPHCRPLLSTPNTPGASVLPPWNVGSSPGPQVSGALPSPCVWTAPPLGNDTSSRRRPPHSGQCYAPGLSVSAGFQADRRLLLRCPPTQLLRFPAQPVGVCPGRLSLCLHSPTPPRPPARTMPAAHPAAHPAPSQCRAFHGAQTPHPSHRGSSPSPWGLPRLRFQGENTM